VANVGSCTSRFRPFLIGEEEFASCRALIDSGLCNVDRLLLDYNIETFPLDVGQNALESSLARDPAVS
jgi:hypothetical protein